MIGAGKVTEYRAYIVGNDGHFQKSNGFVSVDDAAAIEHAKQFVDGHDVELWSAERFVTKLDRHKPV